MSLRLVLQDLLILLRQLYFFGILEKGCRRFYWKTLLTVLFKNPQAIRAFGMDCILYYHLKRHTLFIQKSLSQYLSHPLPEDVLDQKISVEGIPPAQAVGF